MLQSIQLKSLSFHNTSALNFAQERERNALNFFLILIYAVQLIKD
jgi:hypothetical protein